MLLYGCKYIRNYLVAQVFLEKFVRYYFVTGKSAAKCLAAKGKSANVKVLN